MPLVTTTHFVMRSADELRPILASAEGLGGPTPSLAMVPLVSLGGASVPCLFVLVLKWVLLGRVRLGQHALWSC